MLLVASSRIQLELVSEREKKSLIKRTQGCVMERKSNNSPKAAEVTTSD